MFTMILSVVVYNHKLSFGQWAGAGVVFTGISVEAWVKRRGRAHVFHPPLVQIAEWIDHYREKMASFFDPSVRAIANVVRKQKAESTRPISVRVFRGPDLYVFQRGSK